jgi:hypothetical protein
VTLTPFEQQVLDALGEIVDTLDTIADRLDPGSRHPGNPSPARVRVEAPPPPESHY